MRVHGVIPVRLSSSESVPSYAHGNVSNVVRLILLESRRRKAVSRLFTPPTAAETLEAKAAEVRRVLYHVDEVPFLP